MHIVDPKLQGVEDPELEVIKAVLAVDHPDNLDGNKQYADLQGDIGREKMGGNLQGKKHQDDGKKGDIDDHIGVGVGLSSDLAEHRPDLVPLLVVLIDLPHDLFPFLFQAFDDLFLFCVFCFP